MPDVKIIHSVSYLHNDYIYTEYTFEGGTKQYVYQHKNEVLGFPKIIFKDFYDIAEGDGVKIGETGEIC